MKTSLPSRDEVISKIEAMRSSTETRTAIATWAMAIVDNDTVKVADDLVWKVLKILGGADLIGDDRPYLYTEEDFVDWEARLK